jgi:hypothetical protein
VRRLIAWVTWGTIALVAVTVCRYWILWFEVRSVCVSQGIGSSSEQVVGMLKRGSHEYSDRLQHGSIYVTRFAFPYPRHIACWFRFEDGILVDAKFQTGS